MLRSRPPARTRTSVTYDVNSYEAKRLLNLAEEPSSYEKDSIASESHFQVAVPQRRDSMLSPTADKSPTVVIPRASSDVSMYTPMRRRSLLAVPGVATRIPDMPALPRKSKAKFSLPSTPTRRDSVENIGSTMFPDSPPDVDPRSLARASTPCDEDYGHTGAFKLGSLRITNGSPVTSPAVDSPRLLPTNGVPGIYVHDGGKSYFEQQARTQRAASIGTVTQQDNQRSRQSQKYLTPLVTSPRAMHHMAAMPLPGKPPQFLPEVYISPLVIRDPAEARVLDLQTTSKHSALEDDLFEDEPSEYSDVEQLDIRVDLNAKSLPPRPRLISEGRNAREMMRSDSGVAATPISEHPQGSLAKSDSGYSSNVSLRSFSAKPPLPERNETSTNGLKTSPHTPAKDTFPADAKVTAIRTPKHEITTSQPNESIPPPVPQKDSSVSKAVPSRDNSQNPDPACADSRRVPASGIATLMNSSSDTSSASPLSPTSSTASGSGPSPGSSTRKPGKLERLFHSTRKPHTVPLSQPSMLTDVNTLSTGAESTEEEQSGTFSLSLKRLSLRSDSATLRTMVGAESVKDKVPPVPTLPKIVAIATGGQRTSLDTGSDISSQPADVSFSARTDSTRRSVARKPVPIRKNSLEITQLCKKVPRQDSQPNSVHPRTTSSSEEYCHQSLMAAVMSQDGKGSSADSTPSGPHFMVPSELERRAKSPPVSMQTRKGGSTQVGPPVAAKSTPPGANRVSRTPDMPRKSSRENIHSYPPNQPSLSRRSSRENVKSYPPAQAIYNRSDQPSAVPVPGPGDRRRSRSIKTETREHRLPNWTVQTDHDQTSRGPSFDQGHPRVLASHGSLHNLRPSRPEPHAQTQSSTRPMAPRRQSSYDGYSYQQIMEATEPFHEQNLQPANGSHPSMPPNHGDGATLDSWSGPSMQQSPNIQSRYPPHVPRGHSKNNSVGSHGVPAPYRVLHSYNSPAYRNVPIWG